MRACAVGLAGGIGSGKSTIALELARRLACPVASYGAYIRDFVGQSMLNPTRQHFQRASDRLLAQYGIHGLTELIINKSGWDRKTSLVIDGVRHVVAIDAIRAKVSPIPLKVVYLNIDDDTRMDRIRNRDRYVDHDFSTIEAHATEIEVAHEVRARADLVISSVGEVSETADAILSAI